MITFDAILPTLEKVLTQHGKLLDVIPQVLVNRDLFGRVRLIVDRKIAELPDTRALLDSFASDLSRALESHGYPFEELVLFESNLDRVLEGATCFPLREHAKVQILDRLATGSAWSRITNISESCPRVVFFSIKGGVGRSTALAITAWSLAEAGHRVLVLDLDLESPGLSSALVPRGHRPTYGITDWLVEDLVSNEGQLLSDMVLTSDLSRNGTILVAPAHGRDPGEYVAKLGRVWMSKADGAGGYEAWPQRLGRLLAKLEGEYKPDIVLIDSRSGIDEVASACVTELGAESVLLFTADGEQTWSGYKVLFEHWTRLGLVRSVRERLQCVGAMIQTDNGRAAFEHLREQSWSVFNTLYDAVPPGDSGGELFNFDKDDDTAPHYPLPIRWDRGFAGLRSIHSHLSELEPAMVNATFGSLTERLQTIVSGRGRAHE